MIYFLKPVDGGPVKIGCSEDVDRRREQLEWHYGRPLALLGTMPGGREEERAIHVRFAEHRIGRTELFRPVAKVRLAPEAVHSVHRDGRRPRRRRGEMRDPMKRIDALAKQVHDYALELADGEIELTGDDVRMVARLTEKAFIEAMRAAFQLNTAPAAEQEGGES